jgi:sugar-specific transcriptional regulator TrmB
MGMDSRTALETIGLDLKEGRARVLHAVILSQSKTGDAIPFTVFNKTLRSLSSSKEMARPLIYRYLKNLEEAGLIAVDRGSRPVKYSTTTSVLTDALKNLQLQTLAQLKTELKQIKTQQSQISELSLRELAQGMNELLSGTQEVAMPRSAHGREMIQNLIDTEIYSRAVSGDTIRINLAWRFLASPDEKYRERAVVKLIRQGVRIRTILRNAADQDAEILIKRKELYEELREHAAGVEFRISESQKQTYQGVFLNNESVVLLLSESPPTAIWIPRSANAQLADDAIEHFEREFAESIDALDYTVG